ncbi:MAG: ABC transporter substrate-binding protein [bacterium]|nr:ABC transporter substrate-binding protein [bacterium]
MRTAVVSVVLLLTLALALPLQAQSGRLMVYSGLLEAENAVLLGAFAQKTGIRTESIRAGGGELVARIRAERASPKGDINFGGAAEGHEVLAAEGLLLPYKSPEHRFIPVRFRDHKDMWHSFYLGALAITVNRPRFEREMKPKGLDYPKKWEDLLHPAYKGEIVIANPFFSGTAMTFVAGQVLRLGAERGWKYLEDLDKNINHYTRSGTAPAHMASVGEFLVGIVFGHAALTFIAQGHPLYMVYPPGTGWEIGALSIIKGGPNTESAKQFVDWVLSKEGGKLHSDISMRISTRPDVLMPKGVIPFSEIGLLKTYDYGWVAQHRDAILSIWDSKFRR